MNPTDPHQPLEVLVAGGGVAGLEAMLALRALAGEAVAVTLLSPETEFVHRPTAVGDPFAMGAARRYDLAAVAADAGATFWQGALARVDPDRHEVVTDGGEMLRYGVLVVALGARPVPAVTGALTFTGPAEAEAMHGLIQDLEQGFVKRVAFVMPRGVTWPLPLYELALMTATRAFDEGFDDVHVTLVTPERSPLHVFGERASEGVASLLAAAGVTVLTGSEGVPSGQRALIVQPGDRALPVDRVVALPRLEGPRLPGVPADERGFIVTDGHGQVRDVPDVFAAGDGTAYPVKQGGLAAEQADAVARAIAARVGARVNPAPFEPVLRGILLTGNAPQHLRARVHDDGSVASAIAPHALWWPPTKIAAHFLGRYLTDRDEQGGLRPPIPPEATRVEVKLAPVSDGARRGPGLELLGM